MTRASVPLAAALVLAADAFVLVEGAYNRSRPATVGMELTERELRLTRPQRDSTALFLELAWRQRGEMFNFDEGPGWFGKEKLEELGYDCRLPVTDPSARAHYSQMPAKDAFAVLEYDEANWDGAPGESMIGSRLRMVDAGRNLAILRKKYPDGRRYVVVPALVRLSYAEKWDRVARRFLPGAYLRGVVGALQVSEISVPPSGLSVLAPLTQTTGDYFATPEGRARGPRYSATLYYGRRNEPWIDSCRLIAASPR